MHSIYVKWLRINFTYLSLHSLLFVVVIIINLIEWYMYITV